MRLAIRLVRTGRDIGNTQVEHRTNRRPSASDQHVRFERILAVQESGAVRNSVWYENVPAFRVTHFTLGRSLVRRDVLHRLCVAVPHSLPYPDRLAHHRPAAERHRAGDGDVSLASHVPGDLPRSLMLPGPTKLWLGLGLAATQLALTSQVCLRVTSHRNRTDPRI